MPEQAVVEPVVVPTVAAPVVEPDLITKVSQFKKSEPAKADTNNSFFDYKEIDKITDPSAKKFAEDAYKSMQSGFTKKTQELADQRKNFEQKLTEMQNWSPERIQRELLTNPQFLEAAKQIQTSQNPKDSGLTDEQFSALTDGEKARIAGMEKQINDLKTANSNAVMQSTIAQKDAQLQSKFADYNPAQLNEWTQSLATMNLADIREYVYKAQLHDEHVKAAYEMGKTDGRGITQNKLNGISTDGNITINNDAPLEKEKGENDQSFFMRLAQRNLSLSRRK